MVRPFDFGNKPETIRKSIEGSFEKLGIDTIDLYYRHRIDEKIPPADVAGTMQELIKQGKFSIGEFLKQMRII